jgi:hypothetical protein
MPNSESTIVHPNEPQNLANLNTNDTAGAGASHDRGLPPQLTYAGISVGLMLAFGGFALIYLDKAPLLPSLATCVGFGIVLAAFGSRAGGSWSGWTATGAGAMAVILFLVLMSYTPASLPISFQKRGLLQGDLSKVADVRIFDEFPLYEFRDKSNGGGFRFIILEDRFKNERLSIQVDTNEQGEGKEFFEMYGDGKSIAEKYLTVAKNSSQHNEVIKWKLDYKNRTVKDGNDIVFSVPGELDESDLKAAQKKAAAEPSWRFLAPFSSAIAQPLDDETITLTADQLVLDLKSDEPTKRRNARDALSNLGPEVVPQMMEAWRTSKSEYRIRLGVIYALADMLRRDPILREPLLTKLQDDDIRVLVAAASDDDNSVRAQATEFLYLLKDQRAIGPSLQGVRDAKDSNGLHNNVLILRGTSQALPEAEKAKIARDVGSAVGTGESVACCGGFDLKSGSGISAKTQGLVRNPW